MDSNGFALSSFFGWFGGIATCPGPCWHRFSPV